MPPKRKSLFSGPGRVLGSGAEKPAKRTRKSQREEDEADYVPPKDEGEEDDDGNGRPEVSQKREYARRSCKKPTTSDPGSADDQMRYGGRVAVIAHSTDQGTAHPVVNIDPSEETLCYEFVACKKGTFKRVDAKHAPKATKAEIAKWDAEDDGEPCECKSCVTRTTDDPEDFSRSVSEISYGSLRSGSKRGFYKYGEGRTLDG